MSTIKTGPPLQTLGERITDLVTEQRFGLVETDEMFESDLTVMLPKAQEAAQQANDEVPRKPYIIRLECCVASKRPNEPVSSGKDTYGISPESLPRLFPRYLARLSEENDQNPPSPLEIRVTAADGVESKLLSHELAVKVASAKNRKDAICVYLMSTPYTLTWPSFRHGPILLSKADVGRRVEPMDDALDWKAFQMPSRGRVEDIFRNLFKEQGGDQVDQIISWFDTFGFETHGVLLTEDVLDLEFDRGPSMLQSSYSTTLSTPSSTEIDNKLPIPLAGELPSRFWNAAETGWPDEVIKFLKPTGLKRWFCEGARNAHHSTARMIVYHQVR
ncbi:hypothetical protein FOMG_17401 [Fusarium oxysporum f. sp. melonis 26406]|uniref:Uncharacterized protein n=1 Tax=Fusarium oxysporum f. sp. melonis 26406 TaxID=1089452 RepID=W9ZY76_FUSOX|nr:hypothetical protein FOMG_17401 [Fusarium oxysporum f. sp. melonis 26406]